MNPKTRKPDPDMSERLPVRPEPGERVWYAGAWRTPEGAERVRARARIRQRQRRVEGTGR